MVKHVMQEEVRSRKRTHLKDFGYIGRYRYFITICTFDKQALFCKSDAVDQNIKLLIELGKKYSFTIWAYCFMPDHLHLLLDGVDDNSNLRKFISMFKQKTGFWHKKSFGGRLWQANYYEHVLRRQEDLKEVAHYIFANPVRKNLVDDYKQYPFSGSSEFDFNEANF